MFILCSCSDKLLIILRGISFLLSAALLHYNPHPVQVLNSSKWSLRIALALSGYSQRWKIGSWFGESVSSLQRYL